MTKELFLLAAIEEKVAQNQNLRAYCREFVAKGRQTWLAEIAAAASHANTTFEAINNNAVAFNDSAAGQSLYPLLRATA